MNFVWKVPESVELSMIFSKNQKVVEKIHPQFPRAVRRDILSKFGRITHSLQKQMGNSNPLFGEVGGIPATELE